LIFEKNIQSVVIIVLTLFFLIGIVCGRGVEPVSKEGKKFFSEGEFFLMARNYNEAIAEFKKLLIIEPDFEEAYFYLGEAYLGKGFFDEAIYWYRESVEYNPGDSVAWRQLAKAYELKGDLINATKNYYICLQIDPKDFEAQYSLDIIKEKLPEEFPKPEMQTNVAPTGSDEWEINSIYFFVKHNPNKWRIAISEKSADRTKINLQFESISLKDKNKKPIVIIVKLHAEKLRSPSITSIKYADMIADSQKNSRYYIIHRDQSFEKFNNAVKDIFSMKKEGEPLRGIAMFLVRNEIGFYLSSMGPADYYESIKKSFQEFLDNVTLNF